MCDLPNRPKLFSISVAEYASILHQARTLKTDLLQVNIFFSIYHFKTGTLCFLYLPMYSPRFRI